MLLQSVVIVSISVAASYAFYSTETVYQIGGICFYRYIAYALAVVLGYISFSRIRKYVGLAFSLALSTVALSPIGLKAIELFPLFAPFLLVLMGLNTILFIPSSRGREFFGLLAALVLPAIVAESRIGGTYHLLATARSIGYYELTAVTVSIIGGCLYLKYAALGNSRRLELLSNGGAEEDLTRVSAWFNLTVLLIVVCASGISASFIALAPVTADALRTTVAVVPLNVLGLALGAGIAVVIAVFYISQLSNRESHQNK